ncbi:MAG: hypothetical protein HRU20_27485 [Pseudomonadales bacterium]|nr:hypothetical protein [Pseudomonadales bacterium]
MERDLIAHTATASERFIALPIVQGSLIEKGYVLVQLDNTLQKALQNKTEVLLAEANFDKLRNGQ